MPDCRNCAASLDDADNYCPTCGAPQNRTAKRRLDSYVERQAEKRARAAESASESGDRDVGTLERRVSYAVGYAAVVAALASFPDPSGASFLFGGLFVLPPVRRAVGRLTVGRPVRPRAAAVVLVVAVLGGLLLRQFA
jgi:hypothetical protein